MNQLDFFNLRVKEAGNEKLDALVKGKNSMSLLFEIDKDWQGVHTMDVRLNNSLKNSKNLYLFHFNEDTDELELIGKMKNENGYGSIKMKEIRKQYIIVGDISQVSKSKETSSLSANIKNTENNSSYNFSYRITEKTNELNDETKKELEKSLTESGKSINDISIVTSKKDTTIEKNENNLKNPMIISFIILTIILIVILVSLIISYKKRKEQN